MADACSVDIDDRYSVKLMTAWLIKPSPENDEIYGEIEEDEQMDRLIDSIKRQGL